MDRLKQHIHNSEIRTWFSSKRKFEIEIFNIGWNSDWLPKKKIFFHVPNSTFVHVQQRVQQFFKIRAIRNFNMFRVVGKSRYSKQNFILTYINNFTKSFVCILHIHINNTSLLNNTFYVIKVKPSKITLLSPRVLFLFWVFTRLKYKLILRREINIQISLITRKITSWSTKRVSRWPSRSFEGQMMEKRKVSSAGEKEKEFWRMVERHSVKSHSTW